MWDAKYPLTSSISHTFELVFLDPSWSCIKLCCMVFHVWQKKTLLNILFMHVLFSKLKFQPSTFHLWVKVPTNNIHPSNSKWFSFYWFNICHGVKMVKTLQQKPSDRALMTLFALNSAPQRTFSIFLKK
jgi:hypothetical protein